MKLLVIGAGPYGLAVAAHARRHGMDVAVHGRTMDFWRSNMPDGMLLRSGVDWHLDAAGEHTFTAYLADRGIPAAEVTPIPVRTFIDYGDWFAGAAGIAPNGALVRSLAAEGPDGSGFRATLDSGEVVTADAVVAAPGIRQFTVIPPWVPATLPPDRWVHTCDLARLDAVKGLRCVIIGGRQSAHETAALLAEAGAADVQVVHRHPSPALTAADWRFVEPSIANAATIPGWFRGLPEPERHALEQRFWAEGRLKVEPWLADRLASPAVRRRPDTEVVDCSDAPEGVRVTLSDGEQLVADLLVLATGYRADLAAVPYLAPLLDRIDVRDGYPDLDEHMQSTVPGLYLTGFLATRDFGPFFGFVRGCPVAAQIIVDGLLTAAGTSPGSPSRGTAGSRAGAGSRGYPG